MEKWSISCSPYETALANCNKDSILLLDPPYLNTGKVYGRPSFNLSQTENLLKLTLDHQGPIIATNSYWSEGLELYADFGYTIMKAESNQSFHHGKNKEGKASELLAFKNVNLPSQLLDNV
jgi:site-specific DNA-adenine methylase